jgi:hypothetical protein
VGISNPQDILRITGIAMEKQEQGLRKKARVFSGLSILEVERRVQNF